MSWLNNTPKVDCIQIYIELIKTRQGFFRDFTEKIYKKTLCESIMEGDAQARMILLGLTPVCKSYIAIRVGDPNASPQVPRNSLASLPPSPLFENQIGLLYILIIEHAVKLPNRENAIIPPSKLINYLLNVEHKDSGTKARLLARFGYSVSNWRQLNADLRNYHMEADVDVVRVTPYGTRYETSAWLKTPNGELLCTKTIWQIDYGKSIPRLITLIPDCS